MKDLIQAIEWVDDSLRIIDQPKLPLDLSYVRLMRYDAVVEAIKSLAVRGAPAIGIAGAYAVALAVREALHLEEGRRCGFVREALDEIEAARPTAVNLSHAVSVQRQIVTAQEQINENMFRRLVTSAGQIHEKDRQMCNAIGANGADLVPENSTALTICNTGALATGGIGTALGVLYVADERGKLKQVYACETRPLLQGSRLTCWELRRAGINVTLIVDSAAGALMKKGAVDFVIVGADRIAENGDTANKIGTYALAVLARAHEIPFYVAAPETTFDRTLKNLSEDIVEQRDPVEVTCGFGKQSAPENIAVYSPAFDITPTELISAFVTDKGVFPGGRVEGK